MSPIHNQGYRRYVGERAASGRAWMVIASSGLRSLFGRRVFLGLLLVSWFPFFVRAVQIYAAANVPQASFLAPTPAMFRQFLGQQDVFVFFVAVYAGAGLIANDRRANALPIYLSKPLTRAEYVLGKLVILAALLLGITWLPAIVLLAVQIAFAGNLTFFRENLFLWPAITLFSLVEVLVVSASMLALSSLSNSSRFVGILYAGLLFFTSAVYGVIFATTRNTRFSVLSFQANLERLGDAIFRQPSKYASPWPLSLLILVALVAASTWVLERRIRGVEVVA
ncbi:MAG: ABC transporter permease subunit [Acidobacteria bacterium]|nr:ABC transporter permease subunit [Acidobacteriota bacterium]